MLCYAIFEACLLRWKIIRRNVRTAVKVDPMRCHWTQRGY